MPIAPGCLRNANHCDHLISNTAKGARFKTTREKSAMYEKVFIGRQSELAQIQTALNRCKHSNKGTLIDISGGGGLGKSELLRQGALLAKKLQFASTGVIDLAVTANQDTLGLASLIASNLGDEFFTSYNRELSKLDTSHAEQKVDVHRIALAQFIKDLVAYAQHSSIALLMDTLETIEGTVTYEWLTTQVIGSLVENAVVIVAGRNSLQLNLSRVDMPLQPFTEAEIAALAREMYLVQGEEYDLDESLILDIYRKSEGHPILASLAFDWILWTGDTDRLRTIPAASFGRDIALHFTKRSDPKHSEEYSAITLMAILDKRLTDQIYGVVRGLDSEARKQVLERIRRLSFVKYSEEIDSFSLHDKMTELLTQYGAIPPEYTTSVRRIAVENYYLPRIAVTAERAERQARVMEALHYMETYAQQKAYEWFSQEYNDALSSFDLSFCVRLITTIREVTWPQRERYWIDLFEGELQLKRHSPFAATKLFEQICAAEFIIEDQELMSRAFEGLGKCAILGCEIAGENVSRALKHLEKARTILGKTNNGRRRASIENTMGLAYEMLGDHISAQDHYMRSVSIAVELNALALAAETADRLTLLLRRSGKVPEALEWAQKSLTWRLTLDNRRDLASSYHNLGTVYRDLRAKEEGVKHLEVAIGLYYDVGDHLGEAQALKDLGWTYFVFKEKTKAQEYAEKSLVLCDKYGFGRIRGEALHTVFEVVDSELGEAASVPILEEAIRTSRDHGGIFMLLDLLMHQVVIDRRTGNCARIPERIHEIEDYIKRGCQFHYFLGRALVVWGDCILQEGQIAMAFDQYHMGYFQLALGGESAAFLSSYNQHLKQHLPGVLEHLEPQERQLRCKEFINFWTDSGLSQSHPEIPSLCSIHA